MSCSRRCNVTKASDGKWYLTLGNFEHAHDDEDCTVYGPFASQESLEKGLDRHSNPGGMWLDDSGTEAPPKVTVRPTRPTHLYARRGW